MMRCENKKSKFEILISVMIWLLLINFTACSKASDEYDKYKMKKVIKEESTKRKQILLGKLNKGEILNSFEISNLSGIYLAEIKLDEGIAILEKLKDIEDYKSEQYNIYFELAIFYAEKNKGGNNKENKQQLMKKMSEYLNMGFENAPEKAIAFYKRAKGYMVMECIEKAKFDFHEAVNIAKAKDIIYFEDGVYLSKEQFIQLVMNDLNNSKGIKDRCMLDH